MNFVSLGINPHFYLFLSTSFPSSVTFQSNVNEYQKNNIRTCQIINNRKRLKMHQLNSSYLIMKSNYESLLYFINRKNNP